MKSLILLGLMMGTHALAANNCNHNGVTMQSGQKQCIDKVYVSCENGQVSFVENGDCVGSAASKGKIRPHKKK